MLLVKLAFAADFLAEDYASVVAYFRKAGIYAKSKRLNEEIDSALRQ